MVTDSIEREVTISAPVERVWTLLTEADHLGTWFGDSGATIDLRAGGAMSLSWAEHGTHRMRVVAVEPPRRFAYRWPLDDAGDVELDDDNSTLVEFTLEPDGDGTRLRVVESGFARVDRPGELAARLREGNVEGWAIELGHLVEHASRVAA